MAKVFMTVVGTGSYNEVGYQFGDWEYNTRFVQKAILKWCKESGEQFDKIVVFLTEEAEQKNWKQYVRTVTGKEGSRTEITGEGLEPFLRSNFPDVQIVNPRIKSGQAESEIIDIFRVMYEQMDEDDRITFDITHGFRILPLLFFPALSYAKELKHVSVDHIYYGMYIQGQEKGHEKAPIVDLRQYNDILDWANAAHNFVQFGNAAEISKLADDFYLNSGMDKKLFSKSHDLANTLKELTDSILTCRGNTGCTKTTRKYGINGIANRLQYITEASKKVNIKQELLPFDELICHALTSIECFQGDQENYEIGLATAKWCMDRGLVQQAYTALEEAIISFLCVFYAPDFNCVDLTLRTDVISKAITSAQKKDEALSRRAQEKCIMDLCRNGKRKYASVFVKAMQHLSINDIVIIQHIKEKRNTLNHFGMKEEFVQANEIKNALANLYLCSTKMIAEMMNRKDTILSDEAAEQWLAENLLHTQENFVNFSNHTSMNWSVEQTEAALQMLDGGSLVDVPFLPVPANADEAQIRALAQEAVEKIMSQNPAVVMCQGEFGLSYQVISLLRERSVRVVYSCTERHATEFQTENGVRKESVFQFVKFRDF